ncbi:MULTISPECIES: sugar ABC transporter substrate-binding protein [unclassified Streptosporangium]|uniref:sugar ABC transporter substrate-binding protein n=1 Tax=unclassified Streptosporangium TaxID=2632669 RepID=UPI002E2DCE3E|nr:MULTISPECIES: sugar ABC transporter substrate-binding protein [unclassified Streptosporangium]
MRNTPQFPTSRTPHIAAALLLAGALTGCGLTSSASTGKGAAQAGDAVGPIGYSALFLQDPAQSAMVRIFQDEAKQRGLKALSPTSANGDAAKQDSDLRNLVNAGAKSLFVIPADPKAVVPSIKYAMDRGVRVVTLMQGPSGGRTTISMQVDNKQIGEQACRFLAEKVGERGTVLQLEGDMRSTTAQEREAGFDACMKRDHPGITVITKSGGQWDPVKAAQSAAGAMSTDPEIRGIFMHTDGYVPSIHPVLQRAGAAKGRADADHVWTVSVDGTPAAIDAIRADRLDASISQPITAFVSRGLEHLQALAGGEEIPSGPTDYGSTVAPTGDGYPADTYLPLLVDSRNVDDPALWANRRS